ncbi:hypothetical protein [Glycomyces terrestris]|uniref:Uncharacterized protein n=1 Tax=Glycomyces terrestris TaxID=2493553 RepID=A0A426USV2_9ACTN|nr:hypothetical protein [Glycomyces terrestris]RRR96789.1 hypothetical protein EIW28_20280 [Glycomyces terrestris]
MLDSYASMASMRADLTAEYPGAERLPGLSVLYATEVYFDAASRTMIAAFDNLDDRIEPSVFIHQIRARDLLYDHRFIEFAEPRTMRHSEPERYAALRAASLDEIARMIGADDSVFGQDGEPVGDPREVIAAAERDHTWGLSLSQELLAHLDTPPDAQS